MQFHKVYNMNISKKGDSSMNSYKVSGGSRGAGEPVPLPPFWIFVMYKNEVY